MAATKLVLKTAIGNYGNTKALKDGAASAAGITFDFVEVSPIYKAFLAMIQRSEFDVSEMAFTTFLVAKSFNKPLTLLPIVLVRIFHHGTILCNVNSGIREPKDLEGKKVGLRAYAQTGPTWSRGILHSEYGVDLNKVTWVTYEGSHVEEFQDPENVVRAPEGKKMNDMLVAGEIDAAISPYKFVAPEVKPLFENAPEAEANWYRKTGIYPVNHMVVVKTDLALSHPEILRELYEAFKKAKALYLDRLKTNGPSSADDELKLRLMAIVGSDPLPYGIRKNRKGLEAMVRFAFEQKMLPRHYRLEEIFDPAVLDFD
ncbi:MAG: ABC transporter substrate-binding protein [Thermodesulfobacteriota bacterium]